MLLCAFSCEKEEIALPESDASLCNPDKKTVKKVSDTSGFIWFNQSLQTYILYASINGTYDSQIVGLPCNLPENFEKDGLKVELSGKYKDFGEQPSPPQIQIFPGQEYYCLEISKIKLD